MVRPRTKIEIIKIHGIIGLPSKSIFLPHVMQLSFELLLRTFNAIFHVMVGFAFSRCGGRKMNQRDECSSAGIISETGKE